MKYIKGLNLFKKKRLEGENIIKTMDIRNINIEDIEDRFILGIDGKVSISKGIQNIGDVGYIPGIYTSAKIVTGERFCIIDQSQEDIKKGRRKVRRGIAIFISFEGVQYNNILKEYDLSEGDPDDNLEAIEYTRMWPYDEKIDRERDTEIINISNQIIKKINNIELYGIIKTYNEKSNLLNYRIAITAKPI